MYLQSKVFPGPGIIGLTSVVVFLPHRCFVVQSAVCLSGQLSAGTFQKRLRNVSAGLTEKAKQGEQVKKIINRPRGKNLTSWP